MKAIFFDLETTDKNFVGQILNYCFIVVDQNLEVLSELSGLIKLSRLQLPSPGALLANRVDVIKHQACAMEAEPEAMRKVHDFITSVVTDEKAKVPLVGFNSNRFDVPYLRTSLIRNGLNPYFGGRILYRDLLFVAKKLSVSNPQFPRTAKQDSENPSILSLSLENLTRQLGLLKGKQSHESRDDVLLTIELARKIRAEFDTDVLQYDSYEVSALHRTEPAAVLHWALWPSYDLNSSDTCSRAPMCLHDFDHRSALWIDLNRYKEGQGRNSISWFNGTSTQFISGGQVKEPEYQELAQRARKEFEKIKLSNFFQASTCDIEQDIYRLDMQKIGALGRAVWENDVSGLSNCSDKDAKVLWTRFRLANYIAPAAFQAKKGENLSAEQRSFESTLRKYALYRYNGQLQLTKTYDIAADKEKPGTHHQTYKSLLAELEAAYEKGSPDDRQILSSLREYYMTSDLLRVAQDELLKA